MPSIAFENGLLTEEVKAQLIENLTEVSVKITGMPKELFLVSIRELPDENIAVGGKTVKQLKKEIGK